MVVTKKSPFKMAAKLCQGRLRGNGPLTSALAAQCEGTYLEVTWQRDLTISTCAT